MESIKNYFKTIGKGFFNKLFERSIRVYIQNHLGEFLIGKLSTDQVDVGLDGGSFASLYLNAEAINERLEVVNVPFVLVDGYVDVLHLRIPWADISTESIVVEVDGLMLTLKLKEEEIDDGMDMKSMLESMTASMVEEMMKADIAAADIQKISEVGKESSPFESIELMSEFIQSITSRIQVNLTNVIIKTEKCPGVSMELAIECLEYYDKDCSTKRGNKQSNSKATPTGFSNKVIEVSKVTLNLEEIWTRNESPTPLDPIQQSSMAFDIAMSSPPTSGNYMQKSCMSQSIYPGMTSVDPMQQSGFHRQQTGGLIPIISMEKTQTINIQIKNDELLPGPTVDVSWTVESLHVLLSPCVLRLLNQMLNSDNKDGGAKEAPKQTPMTHEDFELCRKVALEEEKQGKFISASSNIDVPSLPIEYHMEMMHGASAGSLLMDEDMFFSANPPGFRRDSAVDISDSASVSTFGANSTFSTTNASAFSHRGRSKENPSGNSSRHRTWDDNTASTQNVNITLPFVSLTVLLEDPEAGAVLPDQQPPNSNLFDPTAKSAPQSAPPLSASYPTKVAMAAASDDQLRPSSVPKSFSSVDPVILFHTDQTNTLSFKNCDHDESDDEEEIFHDSGDYFEPQTHMHESKKDLSKGDSFPSKHLSSLSPPKPINATHKTPAFDHQSSNGSLAESTNSMQRVAVAFFKSLSRLDFRKPLLKLRDEIAGILPFDHLGLLAKPVHVELAQESKHSETKNKLKVAFGKLEVIECLFDCLNGTSDFAKSALPKLPQYSMLLTFDVNNISETPIQFDPYSVFNVQRPKMPHSALTLTMETIQAKRRHKDSPGAKLLLDFGKLTSEVDITIIDRLTHLINIDWAGSGKGNAGCSMAAGSAQLLVDNFGHIDEAIKDEQGSQKLDLDMQIKIQHATLRVRFPVLDLRVDRPSQGHDWWRRNLHKEVLLLEAQAPEASCRLIPDNPWQFEVQVFKIEAYLQEDINTDPILFGEVTVEDAKATPHDGPHFNWPRLVVNVSNKADSALETGEDSDTSGASIDSILEPGLLKRDPGPFSSKKSMYTHDDLSFTDRPSAPKNDESVSPGDAVELRQFREDCLARTSLAIDITVPSVTAFMYSRDFLELLYNRFNNDLLMWEPQPPRSRVYPSVMAPSNTSLGVMHMLQHQGDTLVTSTDSYLSDSEDDESMHYSIYDRHGINKMKSSPPVKMLNKMCFTLSIGNGKLLAIVPHSDPESKNSGVHAEFLITLKDGLLFSVNQYGGDPDLRYLCLQANSAHMYHNSCVMLAVQPGNLDPIRGEKIPAHLRSRIYRSDPGASSRMHSRAGWGPDTPDMLTLVVKTKMDTLDNVKNFTIALRVDGATLRHEMHNPGESWISQVIDLVDLKDFEILGYTLPKIMTEIHVHINNCCVDYRPIHLPVWAFLTIEHLSVCSNIIAESAFSQIRLSLDDTALFLNKKHSKEVNLIDYICVAEMDSFNIWLQFCYDKSGKQKIPKSDLRFAVQELRLLTCADSARALLDLIQYLVSDGDLEESPDEHDEGDLTPTPMEDAMQALPDEELQERHIPSPMLPVPTITPEQEASVVSALEDAMSDCPEPAGNIPDKRNNDRGQGTRVFFQPSKHLDQASDLEKELDGAIQINVSDDSGSSDGMDVSGEEFEIVDATFKEVINIKGSHEVTMLCDGPIELHETFLAKPTSSYDHLRAPDKFPDPEYQYTLKEMSLVWLIFGGSDFLHSGHRGSSSERFGLPRGVKSPRNQRCLSDSGTSAISGGQNRRNSWRHRGGELRDLNVLMELDLNKIRFRYEVYPQTTKQASRFKLLVNNIEIRDRVSASEINKFLVKLVDKEHPMQSSAYMLMFSGIFTRPDYLPFRQECEVKAFCLPIKLNIDQVSLNFLRKFVSHLADPDGENAASSGRSASPLGGGRSSPSDGGGRSSPRGSVSGMDQPIMRVGEPSTKESSMDETELLIKFEDFSNQQSIYLQKKLTEMSETEIPEDDLPVFIKSFVLISDITIKLDYRGKRCDMDSGMMGMMLGVASLTGSVVKLKRIDCQKGILGWDKLLMYAANEWLTDIRTNQIHSILKGVGSLSIFCQIVQGVTDLIRLPIEQYQKDRRIIRGLQRGANSFTLNTVMAILELTNKVVGSIQYCAELGYDMMSPGPSVRRRKTSRHRHRQPRTTAEGAKAALQLVTEGVKESASNLSAIVSEESAHKGYVGVVGGTLRNATPECLFKPLALLAEAGTHIVQGARNEVDPCVMHEEEDRWKYK
ncbi:hypothetical protein EGW08_018186 [Elysia chlorotica]|uniref:Autophagy-related protein 2 n=1 Tax=Elysia chlorotica TaxID=188477 RepID=A0A433SXJ7_ELYCH|nr:hypothetical protein EGW08_018186 [Elysia chlorotica]